MNLQDFKCTTAALSRSGTTGWGRLIGETTLCPEERIKSRTLCSFDNSANMADKVGMETASYFRELFPTTSDRHSCIDPDKTDMVHALTEHCLIFDEDPPWS